jgi:hypothetical protein
MSTQSYEPTPAEQADVLGACIAMLRAALSGDHAGAEMLADQVDLRHALACMSGIAGTFGLIAYDGPAGFAAALSEWQPGTRLGPRPEAIDPNANLDLYPDARDLMVQLARLDRVRLEHVARWVSRRLAGDLR